MKRLTKITILILYIVTSSACSNSHHLSKDQMPDIGVPVENLNTQLQIVVPREWNNFKIGDEVSLVIRVLSENKVAFQKDFGARIFIHDNDGWTEIANLMDYDFLSSDTYILSPYEGNSLNEGTTSVVPKLPYSDKATPVRIFLTGQIYRDGQITSEIIAAYTDVILNP